MLTDPTTTFRLAAQPHPPSCASCGSRELCLPAGLDADATDRLDQLVSARPALRKGDELFHANARFEAVFAVRAGSFKTRVPLPAGEEQTTGLHMPGDLLGMTGIDSGVMACDAIALEDARVCVIDFGRLEALSRALPPLQRRIHRLMSHALLRGEAMVRLLAQASADERVASFLLGVAQRQQALGLPADELAMRMSREEIANLLGLRIETVSRCLTRLHNDGTLDVQGRRIGVRNAGQLRAVARC